MPLPLDNLDRRSFADMVEEGKAMIPVLAPAWTDHNVHDPGITLAELFAWLVEMDLHRLDFLPDASRRAFLRLVGSEPRSPQVAQAVLVLRPSGATRLRAGTLVSNDAGDVVFATVRDVQLSAANLVAITTPDGEAFEKNASADQRFYQPFGNQPATGAELRLSFDDWLGCPGEEISLYVWTKTVHEDHATREQLITEFEDTLATSGEACAEPWWRHYSARTVWEYFAEGDVWRTLQKVTDETRALSLSGFVRFAAPERPAPDAENHFLIRCRLVSGSYECPPELDAIALNTVTARHDVPAADRIEQVSNGRAGQVIQLPVAPVVPRSTRLIVAGDPPWREMPSWDLAGGHDRVYFLDQIAAGNGARARIVFGDGRVGRVPRAGARIAVSFCVGGGAHGNIRANILTRVSGATVGQPFEAAGGADAETIEEAHGRALRRFVAPGRAVTLEDFAALARETPGVPVAAARALAERHPSAPCIAAAGCVTVVVVPDCLKPPAQPGPDFLAAVQRYLDRRRTLATEVHVTGPSYAPVSVSARMHILPGADAKAVTLRAEETLAKFFDPLAGGPEGEGWPVGRDVYRAEVIALLAGVEGVEFVDGFGLTGADDDAPRCGNLPICPDDLVLATNHQLEIVERKLTA